MAIKTLDIPAELDELIKKEKNKPVYNGNYSAVIRTALVYFFDQNHTLLCDKCAE